MDIFELRNIKISLHQNYKQRLILDGVNLKIAPKEHLGLFAPTGSGKTTLLRCLTGLIPKDSGEIFFHGSAISTEADFQKLRRGVGFVVQEASDQIFFPTVIEDVMFGPLNLGFSATDARQRSLRLLETLGILNLKDRNTLHLSGGEKRLVALAGILAMEPEVLLLDEPTTGLDEQAVQRLEDILAHLDCARIVVTHDPLFLSQVADTCYTIIDKKLIPMTTPIPHIHHHAHLGGDQMHEHMHGEM